MIGQEFKDLPLIVQIFLYLVLVCTMSAIAVVADLFFNKGRAFSPENEKEDDFI